MSAESSNYRSKLLFLAYLDVQIADDYFDVMFWIRPVLSFKKLVVANTVELCQATSNCIILERRSSVVDRADRTVTVPEGAFFVWNENRSRRFTAFYRLSRKIVLKIRIS